MKTLITAVTFAALILVPAAFSQSASAAPRNDQSAGPSGTYHGYPLRDWYRPDDY
jgi:hypothetical protein